MIRTSINPNTGKIEFRRDNFVDLFGTVNLADINRTYITDISLMSRPIIRTNPSYPTVNNDPILRKKVVKYFFNKLVDDWLYGSFSDVGKYVIVKDGKAEFSKITSESDNTMNDIKARYITEEIFTKHDLLEVIDKDVRKQNVNWFDLRTKHKSDLKDYIHGKIKKHLIKLL